MAELKDIVAYLIQHYPERMRKELSNARLTKMVYLSDWHQAINYAQQISKIDWYFDNYGPFVSDIEETAREYPKLFGICQDRNLYGQPKKLFTIIDNAYSPKLSKEERTSLDHIIAVTQKLYWNDFLKLVYATYPVASSERYSFLNLVEKAKAYNLTKKEVGA